MKENEHPAAEQYKQLRGKMVEIWARMPRMSFVFDIATIAAGQGPRERKG